MDKSEFISVNLSYTRALLITLQGGRGSCIGRFCCCGVMSTLFLIIAIALSIAMVRLRLYVSLTRIDRIFFSGFDLPTLPLEASDLQPPAALLVFIPSTSHLILSY
jgi:hypothetical protein